jgi:hypothetical protein
MARFEKLGVRTILCAGARIFNPSELNSPQLAMSNLHLLESRHSRMLLAGIQVIFGLDPRIKTFEGDNLGINSIFCYSQLAGVVHRFEPLERLERLEPPRRDGSLLVNMIVRRRRLGLFIL